MKSRGHEPMHSTRIQAQSSATLQEILSQPEAWSKTLTALEQSAIVEKFLRDSSGKTEWLFLGCGTSYYLAEAAAASWTLLTGQRAHALPASEPLLFPDLTLKNAGGLQSVIISRSGSTSEAVRVANLFSREFRIPTLGITCTGDSPLERACDATIRLSTANEKSTVMTCSFTSMLLTLQHLADRKSAQKNLTASLHAMASHFGTQIQSLCDRMEAFVDQHSFADYIFLAQGPFFGIAREASLKVMEMSCSYSQFFHALEFRHGPKAIVSADAALTFFLSEGGYQSECEVLSEMKALGGLTIAVCNRANDLVRRSSDLVFELGFDGPQLAMLAPFVVPAQFLGFFTGIKKKLDPDNPKNLSRVVILD
jgi:glutamine---fructose-6-phosphate transaminase (isomerizing)